MSTQPLVKKSKAELSRILTKRLEAHPMWNLIVDKIVLHNSKGKVWLVGGTVSRILCEELYGTKMEGFDFDFIVQNVNKNTQAPPGWEIGYSKFNNPTFTHGTLKVDLWPISDQHHIKQNKLKSTIKNFFSGTPFTIQAMAYDVKEKKVIGNIGIRALLSREFRVNNAAAAMDEAKRKGVTVDQRLELKAKSMNFTFVPSGK
jgi:hypothetical protein